MAENTSASPRAGRDDGNPRIWSVIGLKEEELMLFLSRLDGRQMTVALTDLCRADLEWLVWHFNRRQALLLLDEVEVLVDIDPDELAEARRTVARVLREMVRAGELPRSCIDRGDRPGT